MVAPQTDGQLHAASRVACTHSDMAAFRSRKQAGYLQTSLKTKSATAV